jgi:hypothetical protein
LAEPTSGTTTLPRQPKDSKELQSVEYSLQNVRGVIYTHVVKYLENHYGCFSEDEVSAQSCSLPLPGALVNITETNREATSPALCTFSSKATASTIGNLARYECHLSNLYSERA